MTRTQWGVVIGLLLFILTIFGILIFQLQVPDLSPTPPPPTFLLEEGAQARTVLPIARGEASRWRPDAQLVSAEVVWDDMGPGGILRRDRWTFQFYSPSLQQLALIRVSEGQASLLRTTLAPNPVPALSLDQWLVDSTQALQTWWEQGGGSFARQHPAVAISLKLRQEPRGSRVLWVVAGSSADQHWVVEIDGTDGTVLD